MERGENRFSNFGRDSDPCVRNLYSQFGDIVSALDLREGDGDEAGFGKLYGVVDEVVDDLGEAFLIAEGCRMLGRFFFGKLKFESF